MEGLNSNESASAPMRTANFRQKRYFSRRSSSKAEIPKLAVDMEEWVGYFSPWAFLVGFLYLCVPVAYIYIFFIVLRELCLTFPESVYGRIHQYIPFLANVISAMQQSSRIVEVWCIIEAAFFLGSKLYIRWLQSRDPLEASLASAPLLRVEERQMLWKRMMESEYPDITFLGGWFFDEPITRMSRYDVADFLCWSMFEGRHQEHLTTVEHLQLESFVDEVEHRLSLLLHGSKTAQKASCGEIPSRDEEETDSQSKESASSRSTDAKGDHEDDEDQWEPITTSDSTTTSSTMSSMQEVSDELSESYAIFYAFRKVLPIPKKAFHFQEKSPNQERTFFSEMFESYRTRYEQMVSADFNPVKDLRTMVANATPDLRTLVEETKERIEKAEESAYATTRHMYERLVPSGSQMDKQLSAMSHATLVQLTEAWNSVKNMKERIETARFLSKRRQSLQQQLRGYRVLLNQMLDSSSASIPSKQMAGLMRRITECYESMERLEGRAQNAFVQATGFAYKNFGFLNQEEPQRFARYSSDPILNVSTYPLGLHLSVFAGTEIPLRVMLRNRGFTRRVIGPVAYYHHPGASEFCDDDEGSHEKTPLIFVHGIGIGLITYMPLIDALVKTGRPVFLPEIPYVCAFRPWQSPHSVLQPAVVCSTMVSMLACHGFLKGAWMGHSYGTSWISYICKYAKHAVASVMFLDPVCFCLHAPTLTKSFVYMPADPGTISYFVRTDLVINLTIQRSFPWPWISLFTDQINVPCSIFLSEKDALVPSGMVEGYLRSKGTPITDFATVTPEHFRSESLINCCVFRGHGHGRWTEIPDQTVPMVVTAAETLCERAESMEKGRD